MRRLPLFSIHQPTSVAEASALRRELGDDAQFYAGGTELLLAMKLGVLRRDHLVDLKRVPDLDGIEYTGSAVRIGGLATHRRIAASPIVREHLPVLATAAARVANPRVRASGTIGGNLCFAEPHSDIATILLCLDASVVASRGEETRTIAVSDLIAGPYATSLEDDEVLLHVDVPVTTGDWRFGYAKFQLHERPSLGIAVGLVLSPDGREVTDARVAVGCVSPQPIRGAESERLLVGSLADSAGRLAEAGDALAEVSELEEDEEGGVDYKANLVRVYLRRVFASAAGRVQA